MKFILAAALLASAIIVPNATAQQQKLATKGCLHNLAWQRSSYTKAHVNVTNSLRQVNPKPVDWNRYKYQHDCLGATRRAKALRLAEDKRWARLRLQRSGIRWIIRRQFSLSGDDNIVQRALKVASCESSYVYNSVSSTGDYGTWQINWVHHVPESVSFSPELSTAWAWRASDHGRNFSPTWTCATRLGIA